MKRFSRKVICALLFGVAAVLTACHDETTTSLGIDTGNNPPKGTVGATVSQTTGTLQAITCALGCCSRKKPNPASQY